MTDLFDKLYSQFLSGKTNRKDFEGFKESLNHLSDQELAERMEAFWNENTVYPPMEVCRKREIHRRLRLQIHPPKISIRWSRIVAAAAVIAVLSVTAWNFSLLHELQNANSSFLAEVPAGDKVQLTLPDKSSVKAVQRIADILCQIEFGKLFVLRLCQRKACRPLEGRGVLPGFQGQETSVCRAGRQSEYRSVGDLLQCLFV